MQRNPERPSRPVTPGNPSGALHNLRMWDTFWPDVLVTVIGAVLTVAIAYGTFLVQQRRTEKQVLTNLIHDLHHRRALRAFTPKYVAGASDLDDYKHTSSSVLEVREQIRTARNSLPPRSSTSPLLSKMLVECNRHLSKSGREPDRYQEHLIDLRTSLTCEVEEICSRVRGLKPLEPGGAMDQPEVVRNERIPRRTETSPSD